MLSSPSTNAAMASVDRCSVEPNWRGPTGLVLCEANCVGSQENARRNTCPGSAIAHAPLQSLLLRGAHYSNVARAAPRNTHQHRSGTRWRPAGSGRADLMTGVAVLGARVSGEVVAQRLATAVDAAPDGAELDAERGADLLVAQTLDVAQHDRGAELRRQRVERGLQVRP